MASRRELPVLEKYDTRRGVDENLRILFKHGQDTSEVLTGILRDLFNQQTQVQAPIVPKARIAAGQVSAASIGVVVFVPDEVGGPTLAFADGAAFRRVQDGAVVS